MDFLIFLKRYEINERNQLIIKDGNKLLQIYKKFEEKGKLLKNTLNYLGRKIKFYLIFEDNVISKRYRKIIYVCKKLFIARDIINHSLFMNQKSIV